MHRRRLIWKILWTSAAARGNRRAAGRPYVAIAWANPWKHRFGTSSSWPPPPPRCGSASRGRQLRRTTSPRNVAAVCRDLADRFDVRLTVILPSGKVVADSTEDPAVLDNHRERPEVVRSTPPARSAARSGPASRGTRTSCIWPCRCVATAGSSAVVRTSLPTAPLAAAQWAIYAEIAAVGLLAVLAAAARRAARGAAGGPRLAETSAAARNTSPAAIGNIDCPTIPSEEIGMLAESLNSMAAQLDDRIQRILRQQSEHQAVLSSMEEGVMAVDRAGTVLSVNEPCAELLGVDPERLRGRSVYEVLRKPDLLKFIENAQASPKSLDGDLRFFSPKERWLHAHGTALARRPRAEDRRADRAARRDAAAAPGERPPRLRGQRLPRAPHADHLDQGLRRDAAWRTASRTAPPRSGFWASCSAR